MTESIPLQPPVSIEPETAVLNPAQWSDEQCKLATDLLGHAALAKRVTFQAKVRGVPDPESVFPDSVIRVVNACPTDLDPATMGAYLLKTAHNLGTSMLRKRSSSEIIVPDIPDVSSAVTGRFETDITNKRLVLEIFARLSEEDRNILSLYYLHELSQKEIAECLDIHEVTVRLKLHRARERARNLSIFANDDVAS